MIIHFAGPSFGIEDNIVFYRGAVKLIYELDHNLAHDWIEPAYHKLARSPGAPHLVTDWGAVVSILSEAIQRCDIAIIYAGAQSYLGVGYQIARALQLKKPLLVVRMKDDKTSVFVTGMKHPLLTLVEINDTHEALEAIEKFIEKNNIPQKDLRFNFVIDRQINNYLKWLSYETGITKAEILRDLIAKDSERG